MAVASPVDRRTAGFGGLLNRARTTASSRAGWGSWMPGALLTLLAGAVGITRPELWRDEIASWAAATDSPGQLLHLLRHTDAVSAVYYACLHVWTGLFGTSVLSLRLPSLFAMTAAAGLTAVAAGRIAGPRVGLLSGVLFAAVPDVSRFAQEARVYAFVVAAYALATVLLVGALDRPSRGRWVGYTAAMTVVGWLNLIAITGLAGHAALLALQPAYRRRTALRGFLVAALVAAICQLPLALVAVHRSTVQIGWITPPSWKSAATFGPQLFGSVPIAIALGGLAAVGLVVARRRAGSLILAALLPAAVLAVVSLVGSTSYWFPRYLLFLLPLIVTLGALAPARLPLAAGLLVMVAVGLFGLGPQSDLRAVTGHEEANLPYPSTRGQEFSYSAAARLIALRSRAGDGYIAPSAISPKEERLGKTSWQLTNGMRYYLPQFLPPGRQLPEALVARSGPEVGDFYPRFITDPTPREVPQDRLWILGFGRHVNVLSLLPASDARFIRQEFPHTTVYFPSPQAKVVLFSR